MTGIVNRVAGFLRPTIAQATEVFTGGGESSGFNVMSTLSTGLTMASAGASYFGAREQAEAINLDASAASAAAGFDAQEADIESDRMMLRGKQEANLIMDDLLQTIAANRVSFAANGVDTSFGTPAASEANLTNLANKKRKTVESDADANRLALRRQAAARRTDAANILTRGAAEAKNVKRAGSINALGTVAGLIDRRIARG